MKIKVEACWSGGDNYHFRMTDPRGHRECISGEYWTREVAKKALDVWEHCYHYPRRSIRFDHY